MFETSNQPVTDIFHFIVFDADNNRLDRQMFTIMITSALTMPSLIAFADHITVVATQDTRNSDKNVLDVRNWPVYLAWGEMTEET